MNIIDRYVEAVIVRLPVANREEVQKQLRSRIAGMLPENASESDIRTLLEQLGNPITLADEYRQVKRYLIGPTIYDRYLYVLKLVMMIVPIIAAMIALLEGIFDASVETGLFDFLIESIANMLAAGIEGAAQAFLWVTITFVIIERKGISTEVFPSKQKKWSVAALTTLPVSKKRGISRSEMIIAIFFSVFFTALIYFKPQLIGWYTLKGGDLTLIEPLFILDRLHDYMPAILLLAFIQFCILAFKFILMRWNIPIAIANAGYNLAISVLYSGMIVDKTLINEGFISQFAILTNTSISIWSQFKWVVAIAFIIGCTVDSIVGFAKCRK